MQENAFESMLNESTHLILDGGLGSELQNRGAVFDPILWSGGALLNDVVQLRNLHIEYLQIGASIITTASYQLTIEGLNMSRGLSLNESLNLITKSTEVALDAINFIKSDSKLFVAASMGSYGAFLADGSEYRPYNSNLNRKYLYTWHDLKFQTLANSGADIIAFETISNIVEVEAMFQLIATYPRCLSSWISMSCKTTTQLNSGEYIEDAIRKIEDFTIEATHNDNGRKVILGVNCSNPLLVEGIIYEMKEYSLKGRQFVAYPNMGEVWDSINNKYVEDTGVKDEAFCKLATKWYDAGAKIIGGCCRTSPKTIALLSNTLKSHIANGCN